MQLGIYNLERKLWPAQGHMAKPGTWPGMGLRALTKGFRRNNHKPMKPAPSWDGALSQLPGDKQATLHS